MRAFFVVDGGLKTGLRRVAGNSVGCDAATTMMGIGASHHSSIIWGHRVSVCLVAESRRSRSEFNDALDEVPGFVMYCLRTDATHANVFQNCKIQALQLDSTFVLEGGEGELGAGMHTLNC